MQSPSSEATIKIGQINLRASLQALDSLLNNPSLLDIDAFLVSDPPTKLRESRVAQLQNYRWISYRDSEAWTGILLRRNINFELLQPPTPFTAAIQLLTPQGPTGLCSFYLKPSLADEAFEDLVHQYQKIHSQCHKLMIAGDSNAHSSLWGPETPPNRLGLLLEDFILTAGLLPLTSSSTPATFHNAAGKPFWIDVSFVTPALASSNPHCSVLEDEVAITDHQLLVTSIPTQKVSLSTKLSWNWKTADWGLLEDEVAIDLQNAGILPAEDFNVFSNVEIDEALQLITNAICSAMEKSISPKETTPRSRAWYDAEVKTAHARMKLAVATWRKAPSEALWEQKSRCTMEYRRLAQKKKETSFRQFCASLGHDTMWSGLKRLSRQSIPEVMALKSNEGLITSASAIAALQAQQFFMDAHRYPASPASLVAHLQRHAWRSHLPVIEQLQDTEELTEGEVSDALKRGRNNEAPGLDQLPNCVLKRLADLLAPPITRIFQACLLRGYFPQAFRQAQVISIPKPDKDPFTPAGYRPISLLSSLGKKLEHILNYRLKRYLEDNHILSEVQFGFRAGRSTQDALHRLADQVSQTFNRRKQLILLSIDLQSAFDSTDNDLVWQKLRSVQIPQYLLRQLDQFLNNRSALLNVQSQTHQSDLQRGVPQGSPLSPTLFALYVNDIPDLCRGEVQCQLYADDLIIWKQIEKDGTSSLDLQRTIEALEKWCDANRMRCNRSKTQLLCITRLRKPHLPRLTFLGTRLQASQTVKYLGIQIDRRFSFHAHINSLERKMIQRLFLIRRMAATHWGTSPWVLRSLIRGILLPQAMYAASAWGPFIIKNSTRINQINRVLRTAAIMITGALRSSPTKEVCHLAGIEDFEELIKISLLRQTPNWDPQIIMKPIKKDTYPSRLAATQEQLSSLPRSTTQLMHGISPSAWKQSIKLWHSEHLMTKFREDKNPSAGRKDLHWGPFSWYPRWTFRKLKRQELSFLAQFLLDHWRSRVYLNRIGKHVSPLCRTCLAAHETRNHVLICPQLQHLRQQHLSHSPNLETLSNQLQIKSTISELTRFLIGLHQEWGLSEDLALL